MSDQASSGVSVANERRRQARVVRRYLDALEAAKARGPRRKRRAAITERLEAIETLMDEAEGNPVKRLQLVQERMDLEAELKSLEREVDLGALEDTFVEIAKPYSDRKGIARAAWRELGVPLAVLRRAGVSPTPQPPPPAAPSAMSRKAFFDSVRGGLFGGSLTQGQVDGMNAILDFWESPPVTPEGDFAVNWNVRSIGWLAYMLATTFHETARTMEPIAEFGDIARFRKLYCNRSDLGNGPANGGQVDDGPRFRGRGYVQLTGRRNYTAMTPVVQHFFPGTPDFTTTPEAVMDRASAAVIMFFGMFNGTFTGFALKNFIGDPAKGQGVDFVNARQIINGLDRADEIAGHAQAFQRALDRASAT